MQRIETFKNTTFYKYLNFANIFLVAFLTYCLFSILLFCKWETKNILEANYSYDSRTIDSYGPPSINQVEITTDDGNLMTVKTSHLFQKPLPNSKLYVGRDLIFDKKLKVKFDFNDSSFWLIYTYPKFIVCMFSLVFGCFIYSINKHLSTNGLLTVFGLFVLSSVYFVTT